MNIRPIDRSKKANVKCEHCQHWNNNNVSYCYCLKDKARSANYWNKCKEFEWRTDSKYKDEVEDGNKLSE